MLEVARRLVGGVWRTTVAEEPNGNGGSQPGAVHTTAAMPFDWTDFAEIPADSGNFGIPLGAIPDLAVGDLILQALVAVDEGLTFETGGDNPPAPTVFSVFVGVPGGDFMTFSRDTPVGASNDYTYGTQVGYVAEFPNPLEQYIVDDTTAVVAWVNFAASGPATAGSGRVWFLVSTPPT